MRLIALGKNGSVFRVEHICSVTTSYRHKDGVWAKDADNCEVSTLDGKTRTVDESLETVVRKWTDALEQLNRKDGVYR